MPRAARWTSTAGGVVVVGCNFISLMLAGAAMGISILSPITGIQLRIGRRRLAVRLVPHAVVRCVTVVLLHFGTFFFLRFCLSAVRL